jgi:hypothetical protein
MKTLRPHVRVNVDKAPRGTYKIKKQAGGFYRLFNGFTGYNIKGKVI